MAIPIASAGPGVRPDLATALRNAGFAVEDPTDLMGWLGESGARALLIPLRSPADVDRLASICASYPCVVVVAELSVLTAHTFRAAICAGASGVVPACAGPDEAAGIIRAAMNQQVLVPQTLLGPLLSC